jgi:hypothetical protein
MNGKLRWDTEPLRAEARCAVDMALSHPLQTMFDADELERLRS